MAAWFFVLAWGAFLIVQVIKLQKRGLLSPLLRWISRYHLRKICPHPFHRILHFHGDERNQGYVAGCMDCWALFKEWPGGSHDATHCVVLDPYDDERYYDE